MVNSNLRKGFGMSTCPFIEAGVIKVIITKLTWLNRWCRNIQFRKNTCIQTIHKYWVLSNCMQHPRKIMKVYRNKFRNIYSCIFQCKLCDPLCKEVLSRPWYCAFSFGSFIFWRRCLNIEILVMVNNRCSVKKICKFWIIFGSFWESVQIVFCTFQCKQVEMNRHPILVITLWFLFIYLQKICFIDHNF